MAKITEAQNILIFDTLLYNIYNLDSLSFILILKIFDKKK